MTSQLRRFVLYLLLGSTSLFSQGQRPDVPVHFRTFGFQVAPDDLYYECKGVDVKVVVIDSARSVFIDQATTNSIVFYRLVPGPDGKPVHEDAAVADITDAGPWPLLVFMKNANDPEHYKITVIADDFKSFPFPACRFVNLASMDIDAAYGGQSVKIKAGSIKLINPQLKSAGQTETRYTTLSKSTPQGPYLLYSNNWVVRPTQRTLVFIAPQGDGLQVTRIIDDWGAVR